MNVNAAFIAPPTSRPEPTSRPDAPTRTDDTTDVDNERIARERAAANRAAFSALMALLSGAGTKVKTDLLKQVPAGDASLIDKLLADETGVAEGALDVGLGVSNRLPTPADDLLLSRAASQQAADAMRYGILKDNTSSGDNDLDLLQAALTASQQGANRTDIGRLDGARDGGLGASDRARLNEVISRIVTRRGASVDQLKAMGDDQAADVRSALDALLSRAGTAVGLALSGVPDNAAMNAAAIASNADALVKANAASAADVTTPVTDTTALAPGLQQRLERVMARMKNEHGSDVTVVETARSQERQDHLYEQGRTRPGAVVTWTQNSAHTRGEAVDVIVDGTYNNPEGFARLQRIAREEGLRTLGQRDPGHLELFAGDREAEGVAATLANATKAAAKPTVEAVPLIATGGGQSGIARVANVAAVANVARVGDSGSDRGYSRNSLKGLDFSSATSTVASSTTSNNARGAGAKSDGSDSGRSPRGDKGLSGARREALGSNALPAFGAAPTTTRALAPDAIEQTAAPAGAASAERVADLQALRDSMPAGSVSRMTLNIDTPDGGQDRITVDLRGNSVGTQINTDATSAERLRMRTAELQDALGRHGLETDTVRISGTTRTEATDPSRVALSDREGLRLNAAQQSASGDGALNQGQRERSANAREWDRPESPRQSRGEERGARDGAGQRGQRDASNGSAYGSTT
jgi:hypothetical protein